MYRCQNCGATFNKKDENKKLVCPNCKNEDETLFALLTEEEEKIITAENERRRTQNIFHIILFSSLAVAIVVLTILIKVLN